MVMEFLFASTIASAVTFQEELSRSGTNNLPTSESTERTGIQKELLERAVKAIEKGNHKTALPLLNRAIRLDPYYPIYYIHLGGCYASLGQWGKALENYDKALDCEGKVYVLSDTSAVQDLVRICEKELTKISKKS